MTEVVRGEKLTVEFEDGGEKVKLVGCHWCGALVEPVYRLWEWWACQECFEETVYG